MPSEVSYSQGALWSKCDNEKSLCILSIPYVRGISEKFERTPAPLLGGCWFPNVTKCVESCCVPELSAEKLQHLSVSHSHRFVLQFAVLSVYHFASVKS